MNGRTAYNQFEEIIDKHKVGDFQKLRWVEPIIKVDKNISPLSKKYLVSVKDQQALDGWAKFYKGKGTPFVMINIKTAVHVWKECFA